MTESKQARHRRKRRDAGLCKIEGCKELSGSDARCPDHAAAHSVAEGLRFQQRRARGLCGWSGCTVVVDTGHCYCPAHRKRITASRLALYRRRRERGLCGWSGCGAFVGHSRAHCEFHAKRTNASRRKVAA